MERENLEETVRCVNMVCWSEGTHEQQEWKSSAVRKQIQPESWVSYVITPHSPTLGVNFFV